MIYITGANGATASINDEFVASGDTFLVNMATVYMIDIKPQENHGAPAMSYLYYELKKRGMIVEIDSKDLENMPLPEGATT